MYDNKKEMRRAVCQCRDMLIEALSPLGSLGDGVAGGEGAIYLWAKLPEGALHSDHCIYACMHVTAKSLTQVGLGPQLKLSR